MPFSPVSWQYRDPITSAKLAQMQENIRTHDHRGDGTRGKAFGRWAAGEGTETARTGTGVVATYVTFPAGRFTTPPHVVATAVVSNSQSVISGVNVGNISATGFTLWLHRSIGSPNTNFAWIATDRG